jgi:hypothetical protein
VLVHGVCPSARGIVVAAKAAAVVVAKVAGRGWTCRWRAIVALLSVLVAKRRSVDGLTGGVRVSRGGRGGRTAVGTAIAGVVAIVVAASSLSRWLPWP